MLAGVWHGHWLANHKVVRQSGLAVHSHMLRHVEVPLLNIAGLIDFWITRLVEGTLPTPAIPG